MEPSDKRSSPPRPVDPHAAYLRGRRLLAGFSLERVAEVAGLSPALVSLLERGYRRLTPARFKSLEGAIEYVARTDPKSPGGPRIFSANAEALALLPWLRSLHSAVGESSPAASAEPTSGDVDAQSNQ